jgi:hypothetical protein
VVADCKAGEIKHCRKKYVCKKAQDNKLYAQFFLVDIK